MKTDRVIAMLASGIDAVDPHVVRVRFAVALGLGLAASASIMLAVLGLRPDIAGAVHVPMFWFKAAFPAMLVAGATLAAVRLSRPGTRLGRAPLAVALPVLVVWGVAAFTLFDAAPAQRYGLVFGGTWAFCPFTIAALAVPVFVAVLWAMKGLAPTRPALAGAAAGLLAGAGGALVYALHCPEMAPPFLAVWYVPGMLVPVVVGGVIGPRLLRW